MPSPEETPTEQIPIQPEQPPISALPNWSPDASKNSDTGPTYELAVEDPGVPKSEEDAQMDQDDRAGEASDSGVDKLRLPALTTFTNQGDGPVIRTVYNSHGPVSSEQIGVPVVPKPEAVEVPTEPAPTPKRWGKALLAKFGIRRDKTQGPEAPK